MSSGLRRSVGATPAITVGTYLSTSLRDEALRDEYSPYLRVDRGIYTLKKTAENGPAKSAKIETPEETMESGALQAFGMFWRRDLVFMDWKA